MLQICNWHRLREFREGSAEKIFECNRKVIAGEKITKVMIQTFLFIAHMILT
jgi:hypothetical protein